MSAAPLGWPGIVRLGLVQTALGAVVVLVTSTLNRVMAVELLLPAAVPGALVGLHYAVQVLRPRWGHGSDSGGRRAPWIAGGMGALAGGAVLASLATALAAGDAVTGLALATLAFALIGAGVGAAGTSLLALLAERVEDGRRPAAAALVWIMMILGFVVTAGVAGHHLDPFSLERLVAVTGAVAAAALALTALALFRVEGPGRTPRAPVLGAPPEPFARALAEVWAEARARRFTVFVFGSMLAYSAQDLILEPFAGVVFGMTPGESTKLGGVQHAGVLVGMIVVGLLGGGRRAGGLLSGWAVGGCVGSGLAMAGLVLAAGVGPAWPLRANVFLLGLANGIFAVAAIGSMMGLARSGAARREGTRVGLWGAAQALAFGLGGLAGTGAVDLGRALGGSPQAAYGFVFAAEAVLFALSAHLAVQVNATLHETCPVKRAAALPPGLEPAREG